MKDHPWHALRQQSGPTGGHYFLTVVDGREQLREMGRLALWEGAQDIVFEGRII